MTNFNDTVIRTVALFAGNTDLTRAELIEVLARQVVGKMNAEAERDRLREEVGELRGLLVGLGAGIPAAAILRAEDRA